MVEPLIEFVRNTHIILLFSLKEHTTDPEDIVYTSLNQLLLKNVCLPKGTYHRSREHGIHMVRQLHIYLLITAQANPISHATDPGNMTCYCRYSYLFIHYYLS